MSPWFPSSSSSRCYRAFGLRLQSTLPLPELHLVDDAGDDGHEATSGAIDVVVRMAAAPPPDAPEILPDVRCDADHFWMDVPRVGRFLVRHGREMVVEPCPDVPDGDVRAYLLGSAMGALLHQRGLLPLHASAVEVNGRAIVFIAPAGSGKSTMAMHLQHRGHRVICDDICAVAIESGGGGGSARLWSGLRNLKLWRASLGAIARTPDGLEPVLVDMDKYRVPVDAPADDRAVDLAAVVLLDWGEDFAISPLPGAEAVGALVANTFRGQLVVPMGRQAAHWRQCLDLFGAAGVYRIVRPRALDQLDRASILIERLSLTPTR